MNELKVILFVLLVGVLVLSVSAHVGERTTGNDYDSQEEYEGYHDCMHLNDDVVGFAPLSPPHWRW